jgi:hypothetical protein
MIHGRKEMFDVSQVVMAASIPVLRTANDNLCGRMSEANNTRWWRCISLRDEDTEKRRGREILFCREVATLATIRILGSMNDTYKRGCPYTSFWVRRTEERRRRVGPGSD